MIILYITRLRRLLLLPAETPNLEQQQLSLTISDSPARVKTWL
jgi:hypothetical protein